MGSRGQAIGEANASATSDRVKQTTGSASGEAFAAAGSGNKRVSQVAVASLAAWSPRVRVDQVARLSLGARPTKAIYDSGVAVLSCTLTAAKKEMISQLSRQALTQGPVMENISQLAVLSLVRTDPGPRQLRDYTFSMDGHSFYVLHLGNTGTLVYDRTTKKWAEWQTQTYNIWKANFGITWQAGVIAGGSDNNIVYNVDPAYMFDDRDTPIVSIVTAGYPMRLRQSIACDEIMVTSSVGYQPGLVNSTLKLETSDNWGTTWTDWGSLDLSQAEQNAEVSWRSLGQINQPGRIFRLTDAGGAALRINSIDMFSRDLPNG